MMCLIKIDLPYTFQNIHSDHIISIFIWYLPQINNELKHIEYSHLKPKRIK